MTFVQKYKKTFDCLLSMTCSKIKKLNDSVKITSLQTSQRTVYTDYIDYNAGAST